MKGVVSMAITDEIMGRLKEAMGHVEHQEPMEMVPGTTSMRPIVEVQQQEEPVEPEIPPFIRRDVDDTGNQLPGPSTLPEWIKALSAEHKQLSAQMSVLEARLASEKESLATQLDHQLQEYNARHEQLLARLETVAKFLGL